MKCMNVEALVSFSSCFLSPFPGNRHKRMNAIRIRKENQVRHASVFLFSRGDIRQLPSLF